MYKSNATETPCFRNFADAINYVQNTRPVGRGPNRGTIPLAKSRRNPDVLSIYVETGRHPMQLDSEPLQHVVQCRYYSTDIVSFYEDGTIVLDDYSSKSTRTLQNTLLPSSIVFSGNNVMIDTHKVSPSVDSYIFRRGSGYHMYPFTDEPIVLLPAKAGEHGGPYKVCGHGYYAGAGRRYHNALHGKFIRQALKQMRIMAAFANDPQLKMFEGECSLVAGGGLDDYNYTADHLDWIIEQADWSPGCTIPVTALNLLLAPMTVRHWVFRTRRVEHYTERMEQWAPLRCEIKSLENRTTWPNFAVLTEKQAVAFLEMTDSMDSV